MQLPAVNKRNVIIGVVIVAALVGAYYAYQAWQKSHPGARLYAGGAGGMLPLNGCTGADAILHAHAGALVFIDPSGTGVHLMVAGSPAPGGSGKLVAGKPISGWNKITAHACNATTGNMDLTVQSTNPAYPSGPVQISVAF